jgi:hypothetical protein
MSFKRLIGPRWPKLCAGNKKQGRSPRLYGRKSIQGLSRKKPALRRSKAELFLRECEEKYGLKSKD